jgi:hypothetical protein
MLLHREILKYLKVCWIISKIWFYRKHPKEILKRKEFNQKVRLKLKKKIKIKKKEKIKQITY